MKRFSLILITAILIAGLSIYLMSSYGRADDGRVLVSGSNIPPRYRDWRLISVAQEAGKLNDLRAILGNDIAYDAALQGRLPYPDGSILARLAWSYDALPESAQAFGQLQSYVAGPPKNGVQFMIKDSQKHASTGGWAFVQFNDGKSVNMVTPSACFSCHETVHARDFVFNRYAP
jgi:hypothetical protein